jgi:hypothetical protein
VKLFLLFLGSNHYFHAFRFIIQQIGLKCGWVNQRILRVKNVAIHQGHSEGYLQEQLLNQKQTYQTEHASSTRSSTVLY